MRKVFPHQDIFVVKGCCTFLKCSETHLFGYMNWCFFGLSAEKQGEDFSILFPFTYLSTLNNLQLSWLDT